MNNTENKLWYFNGIDGSTGNYLTRPMSPRALSEIAIGTPVDPQSLKDAKNWHYRSRETMRPKDDVDLSDLSKTGWGVIFARSDPRAGKIRRSLKALLELRQEQSPPYREFFGDEGYHQNDSKLKFLARRGVGPGPVDPEKIPYYLLIVASPEQIPFSFQYQLDLQYAVGRLHFETLEEYSNYARTVVQSEKGRLKTARRAVFFGVQNSNDPATAMSTEELVQPLAISLKEQQKDWTVSTVVENEATKSRLSKLLGGPETPALLFTASHGMGFPNRHRLQKRRQGALICQDWRGPNSSAPTSAQYFSADDITPDSDLRGTIVFHFGCFTAGTPMMDDYDLPSPSEETRTIAPKPFIASLPQRLLGHPKRGALAVIGHIERAWGTSFLWYGARQLQTFEATLTRLMAGHRIGPSFDYFNDRFAELSTDLSEELLEARLTLSQTQSLPAELAESVAHLWTAKNDARGYVVMGDPAVRLPVR